MIQEVILEEESSKICSEEQLKYQICRKTKWVSDTELQISSLKWSYINKKCVAAIWLWILIWSSYQEKKHQNEVNKKNLLR